VFLFLLLDLIRSLLFSAALILPATSGAIFLFVSPTVLTSVYFYAGEISLLFYAEELLI
jgi:hypothetical protein